MMNCIRGRLELLTFTFPALLPSFIALWLPKWFIGWHSNRTTSVLTRLGLPLLILHESATRLGHFGIAAGIGACMCHTKSSSLILAILVTIRPVNSLLGTRPRLRPSNLNFYSFLYSPSRHVPRPRHRRQCIVLRESWMAAVAMS